MFKKQNNNLLDALVAVGTIVAGGLAVANAFDADAQKARSDRLKAQREANLKRSQAIREQARQSEGKMSITDFMDVMSGKVPTDQALRELLAMDCDNDRYGMYEAMKADGIEFSNVQKMKLRQSFVSRYYQLCV